MTKNILLSKKYVFYQKDQYKNNNSLAVVQNEGKNEISSALFAREFPKLSPDTWIKIDHISKAAKGKIKETSEL